MKFWQTILSALTNQKPVSQEMQKAEAMDFLDKVKAGKFTPPDTPLVLAADEIALLHEASTLIEARATRVYAGAGTRVYGVYVGGGQSSSVQNLKELDSGTLTITTKRLIFTGSMESRLTNLKDIVSVENFADAIEISTTRKAKRQVYRVRNPMLWRGLIKTVSGGGASIRLKCPRCGQPLPLNKGIALIAMNSLRFRAVSKMRYGSKPTVPAVLSNYRNRKLNPVRISALTARPAVNIFALKEEERA